MKKCLSTLAILVLLLVSETTKAQAQFSIGPTASLILSNVSVSDKMFSSDNKAGFKAGLEVNLGLIAGFGLDASLQYMHLSHDLKSNGSNGVVKANDNYINLPIHLRYSFNSIPFVQPQIYVGPSFSVLLDKNTAQVIRDKRFDTGLDLGVGITVIKLVRVRAGYTFGLTNRNNTVVENNTENKTNIGKLSYWTVGASVLF